MRDIEAVVETLGLKRFDIYSGVNASMLAVTYAAMYGERVRRMVVWESFARGLDTLETRPMQVAHGAQANLDNWDEYCRWSAHVSLGWRHPDLATLITPMLIAACSMNAIRDIFLRYTPDDVTPLLGDLSMPVLACQVQDRSNVLPERIDAVVAAIPHCTLYRTADAELVPVAGRNVGRVIETIRDFLDAPGHEQQSSAPRATTAGPSPRPPSPRRSAPPRP